MPTLTAPTLNSTHPHTDRVRKHKDGSVLLSISDDRICKLNGVGAITWMILEDIPVGLTLDEVVRALEQQFDELNSEGELLYEVSHEQLKADTARFLNKMVAMNLLRMTGDARGQEYYSIKDDVSGTTSATVSADPASEDKKTPAQNLEDIKLSKRETLSAFLGLLAFDLLLKFAGFKALIKRVESWPTAEPYTMDREVCKRVRGMVDRAQMYYPKKAMCLQHSAVVTCLLRRRGVPAEMVLAAQEFPVRVHAWAEVEGYVVNDQQSVKNRHREMRRV